MHLAESKREFVDVRRSVKRSKSGHRVDRSSYTPAGSDITRLA
jgi:hypothetical protein